MTSKPISEEQLKAFISKAQADASLQEQLIIERTNAIAIAMAFGFSITS
ncbi:MAG: Nif11-like leader peptide family RiPP precursor [Prochlorococcus sp.]